MKKNKVKIHLYIISLLITICTGFIIGDVSAAALDYIAGRGKALSGALIVLLLFGARYAVDKGLLESRIRIGYSKLVFDVVTSVIVAFLSAGVLELYAVSFLPAKYAVMILVILLTIYFERFIYIECVPEEDGWDDEGEDNEEDREDIEDIENVGDVHGKEDGDTATNDDAINPDELYRLTEKYGNKNSSTLEDEPGKKDEADNNAGKEKRKAVEDKTADSEATIEESDENAKRNHRGLYIINNVLTFRELFTLTLCAVLQIIPLIASMLVLGDIEAGKFRGPYYLAIMILFVFSAGGRAVKDMLYEMEKFDRLHRLTGYAVLSVLLTVFLCFRSVLVGLIFLLSAFLVMVIVPMGLENWGTGGMKKINQTKELLSNFVSRSLGIVMVIVAVWFLSYGAIWETDYLVILAAAIGAIEMMSELNRWDGNYEPDDDYGGYDIDPEDEFWDD